MRKGALALLAIGFILTNPGIANGAPKPNTPKVGACFLYAQDEIQRPSSKKAPVKCRDLHNVETFRVVKSAFKSNPNNDPPIDLSIKVARICEEGVSKSKFFNGWAFKVPTQSEWKSGARWLRCEAFVTQSESETVIFQSWKGSKLDFK